MKIFLMLGLVLSLASCSGNKSDPISAVSSDTYQLEMQAISANINDLGLVVDSGLIDFGSVLPNTKVSQTIRIVNSSTSSKAITISGLYPPLSYKSTCASIAAKRNCSIIISGTISKNDKNIQQVLTINNQEVVVSVTTPDQVPNAPANIVITPSNIDFGSTTQGSVNIKTMTITNPSTEAIDISYPHPTSLGLVSSTCKTMLPARRSCSVQYKFVSPMASGVLAETFWIANNAVSVNAYTDEVAPQPSQEVLNITSSVSTISQSITAPANFSRSIVFTNLTKKPFSGLIIENDSPFSVSSSTCTGALAAKRSCSVTIALDTSALSSQVYESNVKLRAKEGISSTVNIQVNVTATVVVPNLSAGIVLQQSFSGEKYYSANFVDYHPWSIPIGLPDFPSSVVKSGSKSIAIVGNDLYYSTGGAYTLPTAPGAFVHGPRLQEDIVILHNHNESHIRVNILYSKDFGATFSEFSPQGVTTNDPYHELKSFEKSGNTVVLGYFSNSGLGQRFFISKTGIDGVYSEIDVSSYNLPYNPVQPLIRGNKVFIMLSSIIQWLQYDIESNTFEQPLDQPDFPSSGASLHLNAMLKVNDTIVIQTTLIDDFSNHFYVSKDNGLTFNEFFSIFDQLWLLF